MSDSHASHQGLLHAAGLSVSGEALVFPPKAGRTAFIVAASFDERMPVGCAKSVFPANWRFANRNRLCVPDTLPGSGLGLAIVRQVTEAHGGSVDVETAPGGGAVFTLRLPIVVNSQNG